MTWITACKPTTKTREGSSHPDHNAQFEYINRQVRAFQSEVSRMVSVDTKKKELVGDFRSTGREWHRRGHPGQVQAKSFPDEELEREVIPGGVYDLTFNQKGGSAWASIMKYGCVCQGNDSPLVAGDGISPLSRRHRTTGHG